MTLYPGNYRLAQRVLGDAGYQAGRCFQDGDTAVTWYIPPLSELPIVVLQTWTDSNWDVYIQADTTNTIKGTLDALKKATRVEGSKEDGRV